METLLNQKLFEALRLTLGEVRVSNPGEPAVVEYEPDWEYRAGRLTGEVTRWGETYCANCPFCGDIDHHLNLCHLWGVRDPRTGDRRFHLAYCQRERGCVRSQRRQWQLWSLVHKDGHDGGGARIPGHQPDSIAVSARPVELPRIELPSLEPLGRLDNTHPAVSYLLGRGFSPARLSAVYGVGYSARDESARPKIYDPRIVMPIYGLGASTTGQGRRPLVLAGWQARSIGSMTPPGAPKYLTAAGTRKGAVLYGLPLARITRGPVMLVEGVSDVWRVGPNAMALLGRSISQCQLQLLLAHFKGRPVVIWLDEDAQDAAREMAQRLRRARGAAKDRAPVVTATPPPGRADPGECTHEETVDVVLRAVGSHARGPQAGSRVVVASDGAPGSDTDPDSRSAAATPESTPAPAAPVKQAVRAVRFRFQSRGYVFRRWRASDGRVFDVEDGYAMACSGVHGRGPQRGACGAPHLAVVGPGDESGTASTRGYIVDPADLASFLAVHEDVPFACHGAARVLAAISPSLGDVDVYERADRNQIWDIYLLHLELSLATTGEVEYMDDENGDDNDAPSHLASLVRCYVDGGFPEPRRRSRNEFAPLARDAVATWAVYRELRRRAASVVRDSVGLHGAVSPRTLASRARRWGPLGHHLLVKSDILLWSMSARGIHLDQAHVTNLHYRLQQRLASHAAVLARVCDELRRSDGDPPDRPTAPSTSIPAKYLSRLRAHPVHGALVRKFEQARSRLRQLESLLERTVVYPQFRPLVRSARCASYGPFNAHGVPGDREMRACFRPSPGHVFIRLDMKAADLIAFAQWASADSRTEPAVARLINEGDDVLRSIAGHVLGKPPSDVTDEQRQSIKPVVYGLLYGRGSRSIQRQMQDRLDVEIDDGEVSVRLNGCLEALPEIVRFQDPAPHLDMAIARLLDLTPRAHGEATGDTTLMECVDVAEVDLPDAWLGRMALQVAGGAAAPSIACVKCSTADLAWVWQKLAAKKTLFDEEEQQSITERCPSWRLGRALTALADRLLVLTPTGRLRARANHRERCATLIQSTVADAMTLAAWALWRNGYALVNTVHDELLIEVVAGSDLSSHVRRIRQLVVDAMRPVIRDVRISLHLAACERWYREAEAVFDPTTGALVPWRPGPDRTSAA